MSRRSRARAAAARARRRARRLSPLVDAALCLGAAELAPTLRLRAVPTTPVSEAVAREVLRLAEVERVDALVARGLRALGVAEAALDVTARERSGLAMSLSLHDVRARLTTTLDAHGVRHAYLKGTLSDARFWRGAGVRGVTDIDLLVTPADERGADEALEAVGLRRPVRVGVVTDAATQERLYVGSVGGHPLNVDLHVGVCRDPPYRDPGPDIVERRVVYDTPLGRVPGPTPEDALLQATLNLATAKFFSGRLKLLLDAACWLSFEDVDVETFAARAREANAGWAAWALLSLVEERFVVDIPRSAWRALAPSETQQVLARRLAGVACVPRVPTSRAARVLVEWPLIDRPLWPAELLVRWAGWKLGDVVQGKRILGYARGAR